MALTRKKKLELVVEIEKFWGADTAEIIFEGKDGWTVRYIKLYGALNREGELMSNCWARKFWLDEANMSRYRYAWSTYRDHHSSVLDKETKKPLVIPESECDPMRPLKSHNRFLSLRDPYNLPRLSFHSYGDPSLANWIGIKGSHNSAPKHELKEKLEEVSQRKVENIVPV